MTAPFPAVDELISPSPPVPGPVTTTVTITITPVSPHQQLSERKSPLGPGVCATPAPVTEGRLAVGAEPGQAARVAGTGAVRPVGRTRVAQQLTPVTAGDRL